MSGDLFDKCFRFDRSERVKKMGLYPYFRALESGQGTEVIHQGRKMLMAGSNNYLGLADDPRVKEAAIDAVRRYGTGSTGSRLLNGNMEIHERLEGNLAKFVGKPEALVFSTGFLANLGAVSCLVGREDTVVVDRLDHASIMDGCRLAFGTMKRYHHNDMASLKDTLDTLAARGGLLVVVDAVFSMEGDIAPLPDIVRLSKAAGARVMVDEAHGIGVFGPNGQGVTAHFGVTKDVDLIMGTFSKSLAAIGGFIAAEHQVIEFMRHVCRAQIFTAGLSPADVATASKALEILQAEPERRAQLWANTRRLQEGFRQAGFDIGGSQSPIVPVMVGDFEPASRFWRALHDAGIFVNLATEPAVPPGQSMIRVSCMATHTPAQIDRIINTFAEVAAELGIVPTCQPAK